MPVSFDRIPFISTLNSSLRLTNMAFTPLSQILLFIFPIVLVLSGIILLAGYRRTGAGERGCGQCGYNLVATPSEHGKCPECGSDLAKSVVETSINPNLLGRRRMLRRLGYVSLAISLGIGATAITLSTARIRYTPDLILIHVDLPLAFSSPGRILSQEVFDELEMRYDAGQLSPEEIRQVADRTIKEMDDPGHVSWAGSDLLFKMWMDQRISNAELNDIKRIWPVPEITLGDMQYPTAFDVKIFAPCLIQSQLSASDYDSALKMEMIVNRLGFGEQPSQLMSGRRVSRWLDAPQTKSFKMVPPPGEHQVGPTRLRCELIFRLRDLRGWPGDDPESAPLIGEQRHQIDTMIQLKPLPAPPLRNSSESACSALKAELEAHSRIEVNAAGAKIMLALAEQPISRIGTADLAGPLTDTWGTDRPDMLFNDGVIPEEKRHWKSIRLPRDHQADFVDARDLRFKPIWMHQIGFDGDIPKTGDEIVLQFDSRHFDHGLWLTWHSSSLSSTEKLTPPDEILDCRFELRLRVSGSAEKPSTNP